MFNLFLFLNFDHLVCDLMKSNKNNLKSRKKIQFHKKIYDKTNVCYSLSEKYLSGHSLISNKAGGFRHPENGKISRTNIYNPEQYLSTSFFLLNFLSALKLNELGTFIFHLLI